MRCTTPRPRRGCSSARRGAPAWRRPAFSCTASTSCPRAPTSRVGGLPLLAAPLLVWFKALSTATCGGERVLRWGLMLLCAQTHAAAAPWPCRRAHAEQLGGRAACRGIHILPSPRRRHAEQRQRPGCERRGTRGACALACSRAAPLGPLPESGAAAAAPPPTPINSHACLRLLRRGSSAPSTTAASRRQRAQPAAAQAPPTSPLAPARSIQDWVPAPAPRPQAPRRQRAAPPPWQTRPAVSAVLAVLLGGAGWCAAAAAALRGALAQAACAACRACCTHPVPCRPCVQPGGRGCRWGPQRRTRRLRGACRCGAALAWPQRAGWCTPAPLLHLPPSSAADPASHWPAP